MILVTGATGKTGRQLVDVLHAAGKDVRALARTPQSAALPDGVDVVRGDYADPASLEPALDGVDAVFLLWSTGTDETAPAVVDLLARHASRVVYLSAMGIPDDPADATDSILASHRRLELLVERSGVDWTFLRAGGLAGNTLGWAPEIRAEGVVREPFGGVPRALVHERDIAVVAAKALTEDGLVGRRLELSGPEIVSGEQQVQAIADAIGRPLRLEALSRDQAIERMTAFAGDAAIAAGMVDAWAQMVEHPVAPTTTFEDVVGRTATSFGQWARDHAADFS